MKQIKKKLNDSENDRSVSRWIGGRATEEQAVVQKWHVVTSPVTSRRPAGYVARMADVLAWREATSHRITHPPTCLHTEHHGRRGQRPRTRPPFPAHSRCSTDTSEVKN